MKWKWKYFHIYFAQEKKKWNETQHRLQMLQKPNKNGRGYNNEPLKGSYSKTGNCVHKISSIDSNLAMSKKYKSVTS